MLKDLKQHQIFVVDYISRILNITICSAIVKETYSDMFNSTNLCSYSNSLFVNFLFCYEIFAYFNSADKQSIILHLMKCMEMKVMHSPRQPTDLTRYLYVYICTQEIVKLQKFSTVFNVNWCGIWMVYAGVRVFKWTQKLSRENYKKKNSIEQR